VNGKEDKIFFGKKEDIRNITVEKTQRKSGIGLRFRGAWPAFLPVFLLLIAACRQNRPMEVRENPDFQQDIQPIFSRNCALGGCHDSTAAAGLNLSRGKAYSQLAGSDSFNEPDKKRVAPGDADESYLVVKLEGRQSVGKQMPRGREALPESAVQNIRNWINQGAHREEDKKKQ